MRLSVISVNVPCLRVEGVVLGKVTKFNCWAGSVWLRNVQNLEIKCSSTINCLNTLFRRGIKILWLFFFLVLSVIKHQFIKYQSVKWKDLTGWIWLKTYLSTTTKIINFTTIWVNDKFCQTEYQRQSEYSANIFETIPYKRVQPVTTRGQNSDHPQKWYHTNCAVHSFHKFLVTSCQNCIVYVNEWHEKLLLS